jgi:hypothetical protein
MSGSPAKALELEQVAEPEVEPEVELLPRSPAAGAASGATYDKNRGEDQWPEFPGALSLAMRAIQYISNHGGTPTPRLAALQLRGGRLVLPRARCLPLPLNAPTAFQY